MPDSVYNGMRRVQSLLTQLTPLPLRASTNAPSPELPSPSSLPQPPSLQQPTLAATTSFGISQNTLQWLSSSPIVTATSQSSQATSPLTNFSLLSQADRSSAAAESQHFSLPAMQRTLDAVYHDERKALMTLLGTHPLFVDHLNYTDMSVAEQREVCMQQVKLFALQPQFDFSQVVSEPLRYMTVMEMCSYHGCTLATKAGVNFGLFGGSVIALGTKAHHDYFVPRLQDTSVLGCFALTELGHGSNARGIETTATYHPQSKSFILHTPTETAQKIYIGGLATHANHAVVFAQLTVGTSHHGVHAFLLRIRSDDGKTVTEGVRIKDCGVKNGLNGVDNGRMWLDHVHVPRSALLNKYGDVSEDGVYSSPISSKTKRFTVMISALVSGRIVVAQGAVHMAKVGLAIATRYAHTRKQFGPNDNTEIPLIQYTSHQRLLLPLLAKTYALQFGLNKLKKLAADLNSTTQSLSPIDHEFATKELHILASGLKPASTWFKAECLGICRESCGGMGFLAANRIGVLRNDSDIDSTWEGANAVLLQQVSTSLLKAFRQQYSNKNNSKIYNLFNYISDNLAMEYKDKSMILGGVTMPRLKSKRALIFYQHALEYRESRLLRTLVRRLGKRRNLDPFDAWNLSLDVVNQLAKAHIDRQLITAFIDQIDQIEDESEYKSSKLSLEEHQQRLTLLPALRQLCSLYGLTCINEHIGFYLVTNYFTAQQAKSVWENINKLCFILAPLSVQLVDAFGIHPGLLGPIAGDWIQAYSYPNEPGKLSQEKKTK